MRVLIKPILLWIVVMGSLLAQSESAEESGWSISQETAVMSQYLWRGFVLNDSPSLQPGITIGRGGLSVNVWENFSRRGPNSQAWTEHDITAEYAFTRGPFTTSVGYSHYRYPDLLPAEGNHTNEIYVGLSYDHWLQPSFKVYRDIEEGGGTYYFTSIARSFRIDERMQVISSFGVGVNQGQYQPVTTISDVDATVGLAIRLNSHLELAPLFQQMVGHRSLFGSHRACGVKLTVTK